MWKGERKRESDDCAALNAKRAAAGMPSPTLNGKNVNYEIKRPFSSSPLSSPGKGTPQRAFPVISRWRRYTDPFWTPKLFFWLTQSKSSQRTPLSYFELPIDTISSAFCRTSPMKDGRNKRAGSWSRLIEKKANDIITIWYVKWSPSQVGGVSQWLPVNIL